MTEAKPKRRWFRFSIRELLLITVIAGILAGWWIDHRKITKNAAIEFLLLNDRTMLNLRWQISDLEYTQSLLPSNSESFASVGARIADLKKRTDLRHDELLRSLR